MSVFVDIKKRFSGFELDVSFEAENGTLALLGSSGSGKSVTLKCIAGVIKPDSGRIVINDNVVFDSEKGINLPPQKRRVGLLFQNYALFPGMTVQRNILAGMRRNHDKSGNSARLKEMLESFYLADQKDLYPAQLSGGQQQRAALARIMAGEPRILMLDEPLSALDSYLRRRVERGLIKAISGFGGPVLYVSHNRGEVYRVCDRVCVINNGKSEAACGVEELFRAPETLSAAILSGCENISRAEKTGADSVYAVDWGEAVACGREVPEDVKYIGVRSRSMLPMEGGNTLKCVAESITDDIFGVVITLLPLNARDCGDFSRISVELSEKEAADIKKGGQISVGFSKKDVLLLR